MTEEQPIPEKWIGEEIRLVYAGGSATLRSDCTLEDVGDRGVVISYKGATRFHPWNTIISLQIGESEGPRGAQVDSF
jgi:hypothetical protein